MPMAASTSAEAPKMVSRSMLKSFARGGANDDFVHGAHAGDGQSAAGLTQLLADGGGET